MQKGGICRRAVLATVLLLAAGCGSGDDEPTEAAGDAGTVESDDGAVTLTVPDGSLPDGVAMSDLRVREARPEGEAPGVRRAYALEPTGTVFSEPVSLVARVPGDEAAGGLLFAHLGNGDVEGLVGTVREEDGVVTFEGTVDHFSVLVVQEPVYFNAVVKAPAEAEVGESAHIGVDVHPRSRLGPGLAEPEPVTFTYPDVYITEDGAKIFVTGKTTLTTGPPAETYELSGILLVASFMSPAIHDELPGGISVKGRFHDSALSRCDDEGSATFEYHANITFQVAQTGTGEIFTATEWLRAETPFACVKEGALSPLLGALFPDGAGTIEGTGQFEGQQGACAGDRFQSGMRVQLAQRTVTIAQLHPGGVEQSSGGRVLADGLTFVTVDNARQHDEIYIGRVVVGDDGATVLEAINLNGSDGTLLLGDLDSLATLLEQDGLAGAAIDAALAGEPATALLEALEASEGVCQMRVQVKFPDASPGD